MTSAIRSTLPIFLCLVFCLPQDSHKAAPPLDVGSVSLAQRAAMLSHIKQAKPPTAYVVSKFKHYDVVILGEIHQIRQTCAFVSKLIAPLYHEAGVRCYATEFLRARHTERVRKLLTAETFDKATMAEVFRDLPWPTWGYREYRDILESIWRLNRSLPKGAEKMDVCGLDSNWSQYDSWFGDMSRKDSFRMRLEREECMIAAVEKHSLAKKRKALVHVGFAHSVTCQGVRLGTILRKKYGPRVFQVGMHQRWSKRLTPFLEELFAERKTPPVGFDVVKSPLAPLADRQFRQLKAVKPPVLSSMIEGYAFIAPVGKLDKVSWIPGHIDEANFKQAHGVAIKMKWIKEGEFTTPKALDARMQEVFPRP